ncbi:terminase large subunit domain-containing protein [Rhizobium herbae]
MSAPFSKEEWAEIRRQSTEVLAEIIDQVGLPKALLAYQSRAIKLLESSTCHVLFIEKSRRIGLTWGFASYAVLRAGRAKDAGGMDVMYISYSQEMTREFIDACAMWARAFSTAALQMDEFLFDDSDDEGIRSIQAFRIRFASGFEIIGLSSAPRSLRGKQGVVMIDEAAFVDNLKELLKAALAFLMWGGQVVVCSTHNGTENEFNIQIQDILSGRSAYDHLHIDFDEALQEGLYQRICLVTNKPWTPEAEAEWRESIIKFYGDGADEELFCIPTMGTGAWLTGPLIEARMTSNAPVLPLDLPVDFLHLPELKRQSLLAGFMVELEAALEALDPTRMHAFGFDFARVADLSVGTLLSIDKVLKRTSALTFELRGVPGDEQKMITRTVLQAAPRLVGAAFDATGMGWTVAEDMGRIFGLRDKDHPGGLVHPIKFSQEWYRVNMPPLKAAFEDDAIAISKNDDHLSDLRLVKVIRGIPSIPDSRTGETNKKRHGDYAIALALAHFASRMQWSEYSYAAAPPASNRFSETSSNDGERMFRMASLRGRRGIL